MKILVIRLSSIGDIVWTTPAVRALKTQLQGAEIHFCIKKQYKVMAEHNPYIDKVHCFDNDLTALIKQLKAEDFDLIIDLHSNLRSRLIKWNLGKKSYTYFKYSWQRWLLAKFKINRMPITHVADWYMKTLEPLGIKPDGKGLDFFIPEEFEIPLKDLPTTHQNGYVALIIGATEWTKRLPLEKLQELCAHLACPIVLVGGKEDKEQGENLVKLFEGNTKTLLFNTCGAYNICQSASLVKQATFVVGHDTGLMHIAGAFGKKIYAIYGGTMPLGIFPYTPDHVIVSVPDLACRPCAKAGRSSCPKGHFKCMQDIDFTKFIPS